MALEVGQVVSLGNPPFLRFGLAWDATGDCAPDLDASAVAFDLNGNVIDTVYFDKLDGLGGCLAHSGDNRTGEGAGDDEVVEIRFAGVPENVAAFVLCINSYSGEAFTVLKTACVRVVGPDGMELYKLYAGAAAKPGSRSLLVAKIYRAADPSGALVWNFHCCADSGQAQTFSEFLPTMQASLKQVFPSVQVNPTLSIPIMRKGERISIPANSNLVAIGLGWDVVTNGPNLDLDASCLAFDCNCKWLETESVSFARKQNSNHSVVHSGDNLTGEGDGDDELLWCFLQSIPAHVFSLVFVVNIYTMGHTFREVKTAYVRLLDERMEEVVQYPLAETPNSTGLVVCALHRSTMGWRLVAMGKPATGNMARDTAPQVDAMLRPIMQRLDVAAINHSIHVKPMAAVNLSQLPVPKPRYVPGRRGAASHSGGGGASSSVSQDSGSCVLL